MRVLLEAIDGVDIDVANGMSGKERHVTVAVAG